jgi:DNA-binding NarL/FixJ family response regulator
MTTTPVVEVTPTCNLILRELTRDGATNQIIARRTGYSKATVQKYLHYTYRATGTSDRCSLAVALLRRTVLIRVVDRRVDRDAA